MAYFSVQVTERHGCLPHLVLSVILLGAFSACRHAVRACFWLSVFPACSTLSFRLGRILLSPVSSGTDSPASLIQDELRDLYSDLFDLTWEKY